MSFVLCFKAEKTGVRGYEKGGLMRVRMCALCRGVVCEVAGIDCEGE